MASRGPPTCRSGRLRPKPKGFGELRRAPRQRRKLLMVGRRSWWHGAGLLGAVSLGLGLARADGASLALVGGRSLDAELLLARMARLLPAQRGLFGASWPEQ